MLCVKLFSVILIICCLMPEQSQVTGTFSYRFLPCPSYEKTVYATDGTNCYVFRNDCHMRKNHYELLRSKKQGLSRITKTDCRDQCPQICGIEKKAVCGEYAGRHMFFANECELFAIACIYGKPIVKVPNSECLEHKFLMQPT